MTEYIAKHPGYLADVLRIDRDLEAMGFEPLPMEGVRQPFDYTPRKENR